MSGSVSGGGGWLSVRECVQPGRLDAARRRLENAQRVDEDGRMESRRNDPRHWYGRKGIIDWGLTRLS